MKKHKLSKNEWEMVKALRKYERATTTEFVSNEKNEEALFLLTHTMHNTIVSVTGKPDGEIGTHYDFCHWVTDGILRALDGHTVLHLTSDEAELFNLLRKVRRYALESYDIDGRDQAAMCEGGDRPTEDELIRSIGLWEYCKKHTYSLLYLTAKLLSPFDLRNYLNELDNFSFLSYTPEEADKDSLPF